MERCLAQGTRLPHQKHVAAFQVAMRIAPRPLQRQAPGSGAVKDVAHRSAVHAAAACDPSLERVARVKVSDIPRAFGGNAEGVNGGQAATAFTVGLLELLDPFEELQAQVLIESVFGLSLLWLAVGSVAFYCVPWRAAFSTFSRLPDRRNVATLIPGGDRLAN